jgi:hypothetical protein
MKGIFLTAIILTAGMVSNAQNNFPRDFIGKWKGTLEWYRTGTSQPQQVNMELYVLPSKDTAGQYSWHLIYGAATTDSRPYILKPVDTAKGHWVIDELNAIVLDQFWVGNRFVGSFTVGNSTIVNSYYLQNGDLIVEFIAYPEKASSKTGKGSEESPFVDSYTIKSFQRAVLKKQ